MAKAIWHVCRTRKHRPLRGHPPEHDELCRPAGGGSPVISHPYPHRDNEDFIGELKGWKQAASSLNIKAGKPEKSWYLPGHSLLMIIDNSEALERINLGFLVPTGTEHRGCQGRPVRKDHQSRGNQKRTQTGGGRHRRPRGTTGRPIPGLPFPFFTAGRHDATALTETPREPTQLPNPVPTQSLPS